MKQKIHYEETDLCNGLIIDITSDQFEGYDNPVYVGYMDEFHKSFDFVQAVDCDGVDEGRRSILYRVIASYLL